MPVRSSRFRRFWRSSCVIPSANRILMASQALRYSIAVIDLMNEELHRSELSKSFETGQDFFCTHNPA